MKTIKRIVLMLQFYTRIPLPFELPVEEADFGKGIAFAPLVGAVIAGLCMLFFRMGQELGGRYLGAAFYLAFYMVITGCLHVDGLGDTFDGFYSNKPKEKMLDIMRDSRIGTNALAAVLMVTLINFSGIGAINQQVLYPVLFSIPVMGRLGSAAACCFGKYAREGSGTGKAFFSHCRLPQLLIGAGLTLLLCLPFLGLLCSVLMILILVGFNGLFVVWCNRKIGGMTGDTSGAACELSQTLFLLLILLYDKVIGWNWFF